MTCVQQVPGICLDAILQEALQRSKQGGDRCKEKEGGNQAQKASWSGSQSV
jgi:hypothetical protein